MQNDKNRSDLNKYVWLDKLVFFRSFCIDDKYKKYKIDASEYKKYLIYFYKVTMSEVG